MAPDRALSRFKLSVGNKRQALE